MKIIYINSTKHGVKEVLVDDEDYDFLMQWKWFLRKHRNTFYARRNMGTGYYCRKGVNMHRLILKEGDPNIPIDHMDRNGLNNQKSNLRRCTVSENCANKKPRGSSIYLGVYVRSQVRKREKYSGIPKINFRAEVGITVNGKRKRYNLGTFESEIEAARARDKKAKELFGEFANLNFPESI